MVKHEIKNVIKGSIADQLKIEAGDLLLSIDGKEINDILDYQFLMESERFTMLIEKVNGEEWELDIENDYEDIGLEFGEGLMSEYRHCTNNCIFCFVSQMPKGMRETLYFKDDDSRLSFLQGNYITMTNMVDADIDRIIDYNMGPINISVHTTNPELRIKMLNNNRAGDTLNYIQRLYDAGIEMNGQIVLCPGWNDGEELKRTLKDMLKWMPVLHSVSIVPVGLTKYREGLPKLELCTKDKSAETIRIIEEYQVKAMKLYGIHGFHASDELYLKAEIELPDEDSYDGYLQLENGVGMLRLLNEEVNDAIQDININTKIEKISFATGKLSKDFLKIQIDKILKKFPNVTVNIYGIENEFFGKDITVSGLITGRDLIKQLKGKELGSRLILPVNMFRSGEDTMLDDVTAADIEKELGVKVCINEASGYDLLEVINE